MASQEHLASLLYEDDDSTSSSSSDDNGGVDSDRDSVAGLPPQSNDAMPDVFRSLPLQVNSAKKRIKIGIQGRLADRKGNDAIQSASKSQSRIDVNTQEADGPKQAEPPSSNHAMTASRHSLPVYTELKLPSQIPSAEAGGNPPTNDNTAGEEEAESSVLVAKNDQGEIGGLGVAQTMTLESSPVAEAAGTTNFVKTRTRLPVQSVKPVPFPPISSPGLMTNIPLAGAFRELVNPATGLVTPAAVFTHAMELAGYTLENRTQKPHRGSSVQRVVDDMFDSNVKFTLHFPDLIPDKLVHDEVFGRLMRAFTPNSISPQSKKRRLSGFNDIAPKSLTIPYPEDYIQRRVEYVNKVIEREDSILRYQEQELALDAEREKLDLAGKSVPDETKSTVMIPPIPERPSLPRIHELEHFDPDAFDDRHPIYPPKQEGNQSLVSHLDEDCFHIVDGRYFGLSCNSIADPNFCGPNAPGLHGLSLSGGTGLATANTGGASSLTLLVGPAQSSTYVNLNPNPKQQKEPKASKQVATTKKRKGTVSRNHKEAKESTKKTNGDKKETNSGTREANGGTKKSIDPQNKKILKDADLSPKKKSNGPTPTATFNDLRKELEAGGNRAEELHSCIIRSAVYATRCGKHSRSWRAPDGKVYPDIGTAFRSFARIRQCAECKTANMDIYHCRLRKRHKDLDYDGGDSFRAWVPLFKVPMEELVVRAPCMNKSLSTELSAKTALPSTGIAGL